MAVKFSPNGFLDIATDPSELPSSIEGKNEISGAMRRCTNLHLDKDGIASTRHGSSKVNSSALDQTTAYNIVELGGTRYVFAGSKIYRNESSIETGLFAAKWNAIKYNPYNSESVSVFALNGTERKRIDDADVHEWGMEAPSIAPVLQTGILTGLTGDYNAKYTHVRKEGALLICESDPSDAASAAQTLTDESLRVICHHDFTDTQYTNLRIYRTFANGAVYYYDQEINLATYGSYAYIHQWEYDGAYLSGTGFKITTENDTTLFDKKRYYEDGTNIGTFGWGPFYRAYAQGFKPDSDVDINVIGLEILKVGSPPDITIEICSDSGGEPGTVLATTTLFASEVSTSWTWKYIILDEDLSLTDGTLYWLVLRVTTWNPYHYYGIHGYFDLGGSNQFGDSDEIFKTGGSKESLTSYPLYDMNFAICATATGLYQIHFDWEADYSTETDHPAAKSCHYWEPGLLTTNTADTSLGTEVATDHDRPPLGSFVFGPSYNGTCFILKDNLLHYCLPKQPEYWPLTYFLEICSGHTPLIAGTIYDGQVYVASESEIYLVQGSGHESWSPPLDMSAIAGTVSAQCFLAVHGYGLFHLGNDGLYLHSGSKDENITNARFKPIFDGDTVGSIPGIDSTNIANCWLVHYKSKLYFAYPESGSTYPDNLIVTDLRTGKSAHYDYNGAAFPCAVVDEENDRLLAMDTDGYVWQLEDPDQTEDDDTAISWEIESKAFTDQLRKYFPRHARYDVNLNDGATATGYVLLDETAQQSHSITTSRSIKKRLVAGGNGDRLALRISGTGPVDIYAAEAE